jgi:hypothetical protein
VWRHRRSAECAKSWPKAFVDLAASWQDRSSNYLNCHAIADFIKGRWDPFDRNTVTDVLLQDVGSIARMVGIPYFLSAEAVADEKSDANELRKAKQEDEALEEGDEESALSALRISISQRMQAQFGDFIIQRTAKSLGPNGPLISLPELIVIDCNMDLTERELDDLDHCTGSLDEYVFDY